jgi:hypothetical protein
MRLKSRQSKVSSAFGLLAVRSEEAEPGELLAEGQLAVPI